MDTMFTSEIRPGWSGWKRKLEYLENLYELLGDFSEVLKFLRPLLTL